MSSRTPHLIAPYLPLPPSTLTLLTSVLGATTNWLLLRYLVHHLAPRIAGDDGEEPHGREGGEDGEGDTAVVLVSFMRDYAFWKEGAARLGLDLDLAARKSTFTFVDGLTSLSLPAPPPTNKPTKGRRSLRSPKLEDVTREIRAAVAELRRENGRVLLFIDQPDCYLAVAGGQITGLALNDAILSLREEVGATILTLSADDPFIDNQSTNLERSHAAFALSAAHEARAVLSCRMLDTGAASDVSGVLRITGGGADEAGEVEAHEYLYYVGSDWGAKVFERGQ
ncbi:uncharacterized protein DNG_06465 [Cephalotrichum gorgonifer]|uniref:Elongator complex protein 6 n=1 Tax=Cephalotrichum gorgonifer TaxID=2041049 RepID=A0AAE8SXB6_9PEZI|nr:uncharacterized protein DNG_06465 [Cephalotrichum gorgonifer]